MKTYKYILSLFAVLVVIAMQSCSEDVYDVEGNPNALFFFKENATNSFTFNLVRTPVSVSGDKIKVKIPVRSTRTSQENVTVTAIVNSGLVEDYNSSHGTQYMAFPENLTTIAKSTVTIPAGNFVSVDSLEVEVPEEKCNELEPGNYLLPIRISQCSEGRASSVETSTIWVIANVVYKVIKENMPESEIEGVRVEEARSGWSASSQNLSGDFSSIFDCNTSTGVKFPSNGASVVVDIQKSHAITGVCFRADGSGYVSISSMNIALSEDMESWTDMGTATAMAKGTGNYQIVGFYPGKDFRARYIKLSDIQWSGYPQYFGYTLNEFSIYSSDKDFVISVEGVSLNKTELVLSAGESESLVATFTPSNATNKKLTWTSANPTIASVDGSGNVKALQVGETVITVKTDDGGKEAKCTVKVTKQAVNLFRNPGFETTVEKISENKYKDGKDWNVYNANKQENWGSGEPYSSIRVGNQNYLSEGNNSFIMHTATRYLTQKLTLGALKPNTTYTISYDYWTSSPIATNGGVVYKLSFGTTQFGSEILTIDAHETLYSTSDKQSFKVSFTTPSSVGDEVWFTMYRASGNLDKGVDWLDNFKLIEKSAD